MLTTWRELLKGSRVQGQEHLLKSKARTYRNSGEPKDDGLVLVVQGRLAWGKVNKNDGVYILQSYGVWLSGKKAIEGNGTISNTREYSRKNILEETGVGVVYSL